MFKKVKKINVCISFQLLVQMCVYMFRNYFFFCLFINRKCICTAHSTKTYIMSTQTVVLDAINLLMQLALHPLYAFMQFIHSLGIKPVTLVLSADTWTKGIFLQDVQVNLILVLLFVCCSVVGFAHIRFWYKISYHMLLFLRDSLADLTLKYETDSNPTTLCLKRHHHSLKMKNHARVQTEFRNSWTVCMFSGHVI